MRITSGVARGTRLDCPKNARPTLDQVKQAIFSACLSRIGSFEGLRVLDLFAGSGALGIEALSRGGSYATFVEKDKEACSIIRKNIQNSKLEAGADVLQIDFKVFKSEKAFDLIFLDPPYKTNLLEESLKFIIKNDLLHSESLIICEKDEEINIPTKFESVFNKKYGSVYISILKSGI